MTAAPSAIGPGASWERVRDALEARGLVARARGERHIDARCPAHDDGRASLTADYQPGEPGRVLLRCHAGCEFADVVAALGLREADTYDGPPPEGARRPLRPRPPARAAAVPARDRAKCDHRWSEVESYRYTDADGEIVCEVVRQACQECGGKNFPVRRPDGRGGWEWKWPTMAARPLYRLPAVRAAVAEGRTVYVAEGEKDVHALERAGQVATCNPGGAGKFRPAHAAELAGAARVVIVADRDPAGYKHAAAVAELLAAVAPPPGAVEVVEAAEGKDAADHLAAGRTLEELAAIDPAAKLAELERVVTPITSRRPAAAARAATEYRDDDQDDQDDQDDDGEPELPPGAEPVEGSPGWAYAPPSDGSQGSVWQLTGSGKRRDWTRVLGWAPDVLARLVTEADDGRATGRHYEVRVGEDTQVVNNVDLRSGEAWDKFPDATGLGVKKVREVMHNVVTGHARRQPRTVATTRTGWHASDDGARCYVWPDGRTFPEGKPIRVIGMPDKLAAAARPRGEATDAEIRQALADIAQYGRHGGMLGLGAGARSFGQSIRAVPAGLAVWGEPNAGKSMLGWHGRSLAVTGRGTKIPGWPAVTTSSFSSTKTMLELAANTEADIPTLFEDLALPVDAAAIEVREANAKIEALIRSVANDDQIRGRAGRDLIAAPANYVRSIPLLTAERMPPVMMASLYRRALVPRLYPGQIDTKWYQANSAGMLTPLRTIGARVVELLYELGEDAADQLDKYTTAALAELSAAIGDASWVTEVPAMGGVIDATAAILGGLYLVAEVVPGTDPAMLTAPALAYLPEALAEQAAVIADRGTHTGSLRDAVGEILTRALAARRAHICGKNGRPAPLVPGLAPSEQGLRDVGSMHGQEYEGSGVPLYWLADRGAIGVQTKSLHGLLAEYRDPRTAGLTPRSLPEALLRDGASIRNETQKGRSATHLVSVGGTDTWLILLRAEVLTGDFSARSSYSIDRNDRNDSVAGQSHENEPSAENGQKIDSRAGQSASEPFPDAPAAPAAEAVTGSVAVPIDLSPIDRNAGKDSSGRPAGAEPAGRAAAPAIVPADRSSRPTASGRFTASAVVADAGGAWLAVTDRVEPLELPELGGLADVLGWVKSLRLGVQRPGGRPDDPVGVILPGLAARLGLPASPPEAGTKAAGSHPALEALRAAGWEGTAELRSWMAFYQPGERGWIRLWLPHWDDPDPRRRPLWGPDGTDAVTLAWRYGRFAEVVGIGWRLTGGMTGIDLARTFPRKKLALEAAEPPKPALVPTLESDYHWWRKPTTDETAGGWIHFYDANAMYLAAYQALVNCGGWRHVEAPGFDAKTPGYYLLEEVPAPANRMMPDVLNPTGRDTGAKRGGWFTTAALARAAELGADIRPREAWLPDSANYGRWYGPWYERLRDARTALSAETDEDSRAVLAAVKLVWHETHGMLAPTRRPAEPTPRYRPDHRHMIIATARANLDRRLARIGDTAGRWPLAILTDALAYASADPDPITACPPGLALGGGLGEYKHAGSLPMQAVVELQNDPSTSAAELLGTPGSRNIGALFDAAHKWWKENRNGA